MLFLSNTQAMHRIDEAICSNNVGWTKSILNKSSINVEQKKEILELSKRILKERQDSSRSLFRSPRDLFRLLFGLGVNGSGCLILMFSLASSAVFNEFASNEMLGMYLIATLGIGGVTWLFGLYNAIKGWKMSSANGKLNRARQIQQFISKLNPEEE